MAPLHSLDGREPLPAVDEQIAPLEARFEIMDGELIHVAPADGPHGTSHATVAALMQAHVGIAFQVAVDMLTRTSQSDDVAPDVSVFPRAPDPRTGRRQLEHLAFEVVSKQSLAYAGRKAAKLIGRGVRRVFAIDVERRRALEWTDGSWRELDHHARIEDLALVTPLPVSALLHAASADNAVARALIAKRNPEISALVSRREAEARRDGLAEGRRDGLAEGRRDGLAEGRRDGLAEGRAEAVLAVLRVRRVAMAPQDRARILAERDQDRLGRWLLHAETCATIAELLAVL